MLSEGNAAGCCCGPGQHAKTAVAGSVPYIGQRKKGCKTKAWHPWSQERGKTNQKRADVVADTGFDQQGRVYPTEGTI